MFAYMVRTKVERLPALLSEQKTIMHNFIFQSFTTHLKSA
jgi:hypothetical protein